VSERPYTEEKIKRFGEMWQTGNGILKTHGFGQPLFMLTCEGCMDARFRWQIRRRKRAWANNSGLAMPGERIKNGMSHVPWVGRRVICSAECSQRMRPRPTVEGRSRQVHSGCRGAANQSDPAQIVHAPGHKG
jgi:hypothetical protein